MFKEYKLSDLYTISSGLSKPADQFGFGQPFLSFSNVFRNYFVPSELGQLVNSNSKEQVTCSIKRGDVFLTRTSETLEELGMSSVALKDYPNATFNGFTKRLRPIKDGVVHPEFIGYYLRSPYFRGEVTAYSTLTTRASLNNEIIERLRIKLPPLPFQKKIASILSNYDNLLENNNRRIAILEEMAEEIYKEWFIRLRFPNWKETKIEHGIPDGWEEIIVEDAFEIIGGGTPRKDTDEYWVDGNINWFTPSDITAAKGLFLSSSGLKTNKLGLRKSSSKLFPPYCVMMTSRATIGAIGINTTKACTNQGFITCIPNEKITFPYILNWIRQNISYIDLIASGATFKEIGRSLFKKLKILRPDKKTMDDFSQIVIPVYKEIEILQTKNTNLQKTRDLLLPRLVSGKLSLKHLVPETATF